MEAESFERFLASLVDGMIVTSALAFIYRFIDSTTTQECNIRQVARSRLTAWLVSIIYASTTVSIYGATLGKKMFGLRVIRLGYPNQNVRLSISVLREALKHIPGLLIFTPFINNFPWDAACSTQVIKSS
eukprot:NODE_8833_length_642_cov_42.976879_g8208_i0.p1 GENE.NODE_8833_length_642_cov_42.976879_g8208_i0~~NODE_8833_length_642_cov_42.976879_g8208_i0.p1  ORF type:complete len:130 (-),score=8.56 NODE_8833_length_642_cov_42.976879_g8208_i0:189-578(-)